jgi:hypothetical protein
MSTEAMGMIYLAVGIFGLVLAVCWIVLPFALIGVKPPKSFRGAISTLTRPIGDCANHSPFSWLTPAARPDAHRGRFSMVRAKSYTVSAGAATV